MTAELTKETLAELATRLPVIAGSPRARWLRPHEEPPTVDVEQIAADLNNLAQMAQTALDASTVEEPPVRWTREMVSERYRREIPGLILEGLNNWVVHAHTPGTFICALLQNDLMRAVGNADPTTASALPLIVEYVYNRLPSACYGSAQVMREWAGVEERYLGDNLVWPEASR